MKNVLTEDQSNQLLALLKTRFYHFSSRHKNFSWEEIENRLKNNPEKLWSLNEMEISGGEPDVVDYDKKDDQFIFFDCSPESPKGRRSWCYDKEALDKRKENKPANSAIEAAKQMGVEILNEDQYRFLQTLGEFDLKTSSWIQTPISIRKLGGALFCDRRYDTVFVYHNGADSYYAARGFRASLSV